MFLYVLNISLPFHIVEVAVFDLSVCGKFVVRLYCGGSSLWIGLDEWLVKVSWLGKLVSVFWWISSLWSAMKCPVVSFEVSVGLV